MTRLEIIKFEAHELVAFGQFLLVDKLLKNYCHFVISLQDQLSANCCPEKAKYSTRRREWPTVESRTSNDATPNPHSDNNNNNDNDRRHDPVCNSLQLVRTGLIDLLFAILFLGVWCTDKMVEFYLDKLSKSKPSSSLISSFATNLHCLSSRTHVLIARLRQIENFNILTRCSTSQLTTILHNLKETLITNSTKILIFVHGEVVAKVLFSWLKEVSNEHVDYKLVKPGLLSSRADVEVSQEARSNCNTFVINSAVAGKLHAFAGQCDLLMSFDFSVNRDMNMIVDRATYLRDSGKHLIFSIEGIDQNPENQVSCALKSTQQSAICQDNSREAHFQSSMAKVAQRSEASSDTASLKSLADQQSSPSSWLVQRKRLAERFSGRPVQGQRECFFYAISMSLNKLNPEEFRGRNRRTFNPIEARNGFALVCAKRLPKSCAFPIYTQSGELRVSLDFLCTFTIKDEEVARLQSFHEFVFSKVLGYDKPSLFKFDPEGSAFKVLIAPIVRINRPESSEKRVIVDWHLVQKIVDLKTRNLNAKPTEQEQRDFTFKPHNYIDAVVFPWYRQFQDDKSVAYSVERIMTDLNPMCKFPKQNFTSFYDYFKSKYGVELHDKGQPLLDVKQAVASRKFNVLLPNFVDTKGQRLLSPDSNKSSGQRNLLIPELCNIHPLPKSLWTQAVTLPGVLYRLNSLQLAEELRRKIAKEIGLKEAPKDIEWPALDFSWLFTSSQSETSGLNQCELAWLSEAHRVELHQQHAKIDALNQELHSAAIQLPAENLTVQTIERANKNLNAHMEKLFGVQIESERTSLSEWYSIFRNLNMLSEESVEQSRGSRASPQAAVAGIVVIENKTGNNQAETNDLMQLDDEVKIADKPHVDKNVQPTTRSQMSFDVKRDEVHSSIGPDPATILSAITLGVCGDAISLERLETLGDSFLKFSTSVYSFCTNESLGEGGLTSLRMRQICNANLTQLAQAKRLSDYIIGQKFCPIATWLPPGYSTVAKQQQLQQQCGFLEGFDDGPQRVKIGKTTSAQGPLVELLTHQAMTSKSVADCVEALIGAYLVSSGGQRAALLFMNWLGLKVLPSTFNLKRDLEECSADRSPPRETWRWLDYSLNLGAEHSSALARVWETKRLDELELKLNYKFNSRQLLVQALVHGSSRLKSVFGDLERLEFLGDSVLDYLLTRCLYEDPKGHEPGYMTDLRAALANNQFVAKLALKHGLHQFLIHESQLLDQSINDFSRRITSNLNGGLFAVNCDQYDEDNMDFPMVLSNIYESIAGAIFLDSGLSLDQVWQAYYPIIGQQIEQYSCSAYPKSPLRKLYERMPLMVHVHEVEQKPDLTFRSVIKVVGHGEFSGVGKSKRVAMALAACKALERLDALGTTTGKSKK